LLSTLAFGPDGLVYVTDADDKRIYQLSNDFSMATFLANGTGMVSFGRLSGIAADARGRIYVSDEGSNFIARMDNITGSGWISFGTLGSGIGQFNHPEAIAVDSRGRIYVADTGNRRIVRLNDMNGNGWTELGTHGAGALQFAYPSGVFVVPRF
jgi:DNA-binding beta-propeller fold protein YncE